VKSKISVTLDEALLREIDALVDGIRIRNRSQAIEFLVRKGLAERKTAVILAGGEAKRLRTSGTYKFLLPYKNKPAIEHAVLSLRKNGFKEIIVIGRKAVLSEIFKVIGNGNGYGVEIKYIEEGEERPVTKQDTARTLKHAMGVIRKPFLCMYCDVLFDFPLSDAWNFHVKGESVATLLVKANPQPEKWGNVRMEGNVVKEFIEKPGKSENYLIYTGMFIASPELLSQPGNSLEYEIFPRLARKGMLTGYLISGFCEHVDKLE